MNGQNYLTNYRLASSNGYLQELSPEQRQATATILGYPEGTAGRVMTTEYVRLRRRIDCGRSLKQNSPSGRR